MIEVTELQRLPLFKRASRNRLDEALAAFVPCAIGAGEVLMREGETDRSLIVVLQGELSVHLGASRIELTRVGRGELLGDMALFGALDRRSATVISCRDCRILLLDEQGLHYLKMKRSPMVRLLEEHALETVARRVRETNRLIASVAPGTELAAPPRPGLFVRMGLSKAPRPEVPEPTPLDGLRTAPAFRAQSSATLARLASHAEVQLVSPGQRIQEEGKPTEHGFVLVNGVVDLHRSTLRGGHERVARLREGSFFGLAGVVDGGASESTCIAAAPSWVVRLPTAELQTGEDSDPAEAVALRRAMFNGLSTELRLTNSHVEFLQTSLNGRSIDPRFHR